MEQIIPKKGFPILTKLCKCPSPLRYPTGYYMPSVIEYAKDAAETLINLFPGDNIAIIARGSSGSIIGGLIANYMLQSSEITVKIIISRKSQESCHTLNLDGIEEVVNFSEDNPFRIIIVDDFFDTGDTICSIVKNIEKNLNYPFIFDALVIHNSFFGENTGIIRYNDSLQVKDVTKEVEDILLTKFLNILCT